jgi:hypothetical protein
MTLHRQCCHAAWMGVPAVVGLGPVAAGVVLVTRATQHSAE